jgi:hypothetical protein
MRQRRGEKDDGNGLSILACLPVQGLGALPSSEQRAYPSGAEMQAIYMPPLCTDDGASGKLSCTPAPQTTTFNITIWQNRRASPWVGRRSNCDPMARPVKDAPATAWPAPLSVAQCPFGDASLIATSSFLRCALHNRDSRPGERRETPPSAG